MLDDETKAGVMGLLLGMVITLIVTAAICFSEAAETKMEACTILLADPQVSETTRAYCKGPR